MIKNIFNYFTYPTEDKFKYSERDLNMYREKKVLLPLNDKDDKKYHYYTSNILNALLKDINKEVKSINISESFINYHFVNSIRSSLSIEEERYTIKEIQSNKDKLVLNTKLAHVYAFGSKEISLANTKIIFAMMSKDDPKGYKPEFRTKDVFITDGINFKTMENPKNISTKLSTLYDFINESDINPLLLSVLTHYIFENIHPFPDYNGRTGRILIHQVLMVKTGKTINFFSQAINLFRQDYYKAFEQVEKQGDLTHMIFFILSSLRKYLYAIDQTDNSLIPSDREVLINLKATRTKTITVQKYIKMFRIKISRQTINEQFNRLVKKGYLIKQGSTTFTYKVK